MQKSTLTQRGEIRRLMQENELPLDVVAVDHGWAFDAARIPWRAGEPLDQRLAAITHDQATALIRELTEED